MDRLRKNESKTELPANFNELKKSINRTSNWRERLDAIEDLGQYKSRETIELLKYRLTGDPVYKVQEAAYRKLIALGEQVTKPERKNGELIKDTKKILLRLKKSLPANHSYEDFKEKVKKVRLDLYDVYEGEKGTDFDKWLKEKWDTLLTR
ncbi:HEAT repeat domain-containing protein [Halalkalibacter alkalisediminis]|uniref:HEAT repeat domain-containing protein n=1 Tax=Halalkalibacter alkalisediminis TaxID=935616 RepID=A0ABV6NQ00_9BACI